MQVNFCDLSSETDAIRAELMQAVGRVVSSGRFILGQELDAFETQFKAFCSCQYAIGVASGTDALFLSLKAIDVGPGHEVITVANTFAATALAVVYTGATPVFVDIEKDSHLIDPDRIEDAITDKTRAIIPVHLYGQCADMGPIMDIADRHGLYVIEDACQAHGATYHHQSASGRAGSMGHMAAFSFYPTKNLGACGDAGIITTRDEALNRRLRLLRNYGQADRYHYGIPGYNSRLDEIQAAILRVKLGYLEGYIRSRRRIASIYNKGLIGIDHTIRKETTISGHVYHLYVIQVDKRDSLQGFLADKDIDTLIHYPVPLHRQKAFNSAKTPRDLVETQRRADTILSLPMYPVLRDKDIEYVIENIRGFFD
ncbi:MAG: DegT/DnrJ/EryC1/StrS family aminotransferase [Thermodesulfobacteriota bacterium]|nr:DegT/DnrJ/EryC1/StrS family aminotransferase [Thermodesulfobacteriota bacterium]